MNAFAKRRIKAGFLQEEVATAINVDRSTVAKWETGVAKPRADKLIAISQLYKCPVEALLSGGDDAQEDVEKAV